MKAKQIMGKPVMVHSIEVGGCGNPACQAVHLILRDAAGAVVVSAGMPPPVALRLACDIVRAADRDLAAPRGTLQ